LSTSEEITPLPKFGSPSVGTRTLGLFLIATHNYIQYAEALVASAIKQVHPNLHLKIVLLTDDIARGSFLQQDFPASQIVVRSIPSLGWPEATLYRFELMLAEWNQMNCELVAYMDADMEFVREFDASDFMKPLSSTSGIVLVRHPGYFNRNVIYRYLLKTVLGPWEHRKQSCAFVPARMRKTYVCGGMFWGRATEFRELLQELALAVREDFRNGLRARHNDESHLNRWYTENLDRCVAVSPKWAFDTTYQHLADIKPIVVAVRKPKTFKRALTQI